MICTATIGCSRGASPGHEVAKGFTNESKLEHLPSGVAPFLSLSVLSRAVGNEGMSTPARLNLGDLDGDISGELSTWSLTCDS